MANDAPLRFIEITEECRNLALLILARVEDQLGVHAGECNWGHVGDAGRLRDALKAAAETLGPGL